MFTILGLITTGFKTLLSLFGWYKANRDVEAGKMIQKNDDLAAILAQQKRQEQAAANAPVTKEQLEGRLNKGDF